MKSPQRKTRLLSRLRPSQLELLAAMERTETLSAAAREVKFSRSRRRRVCCGLWHPI